MLLTGTRRVLILTCCLMMMMMMIAMVQGSTNEIPQKSTAFHDPATLERLFSNFVEAQYRKQVQTSLIYSSSTSDIKDRAMIIVDENGRVIGQTVNNGTSNMQCSEVPADDFECDFDQNCIMGLVYETSCTLRNITFNSTDPLSNNETIIHNDYITDCQGSKTFLRNYTCNYCWQLTENVHYTCNIPSRRYFKKVCSNSGTSSYAAICVANSDVVCMGSRTFYKNKVCDFTSGKKWTHAVLYSIFLGGFGADRFYLGDIGYAFFKLLSFGGLGIWALVDVLLLLCGYTSPADGSVFY